MKLQLLFVLGFAIHAICATGLADEMLNYDSQIAPLLKMHCVKCHGPIKQEGLLNLSTPYDVVRGNDAGAVIVPHDLAASRLWEQVVSDAMPPEAPLSASQKNLLQRWILAGAPGLSTATSDIDSQYHWSFRPLASCNIPNVQVRSGLENEIDQFVQAALESHNITANKQANMSTLIRRVSLDVTGLPPTLDELERFSADSSSDAWSRIVDYYLASPQYGVRWGKYWLDAAGYADSNGYFNADSNRPFAYRYRDYVVRSFNEDKPLDRFVVEQIAGDELARFQSGQVATPEIVELLEATHYLRNGQDGSSESDGNPDEVRADRYYALESAMQNISSSLLGLTIQCAKCHDHKFEPLTQMDYYRWQAVFYPAFNIERWLSPKERFVYAPLANEQQQWEQDVEAALQEVVALRAGLSDWVKSHRARGEVLFEDSFNSPSTALADGWSNTAPGDDAPGGQVPINVDSDLSPAATIKDGHLWIIEGGTQGDSWLSTKAAIDWTPDEVGQAVQVTFDLIDNKLPAAGQAAQRIGYFIALHDFNDNSETPGGNLLIDGNPTEGSSTLLDYPGADSRSLGTLGTTGYVPGNNYGIRITNIDNNKYRIQQLVNSIPDEKSIDVAKIDLPDGGFGFEYCCGRSFIVDNVLIERIAVAPNDPAVAELVQRQKSLTEAVQRHKALAENPPGKIAWSSDMSTELPEVHLLARGSYTARTSVVQPNAFLVLSDPSNTYEVTEAHKSERTSGRRLAWAQWVTARDSRAAALLARVQVNRIWQYYFGKGIVATSDNFGISGAPPTHPELLDWLASQLVGDNWSIKSIHRQILNSATYRRSAQLQNDSYQADPNNRFLWRFSPRRLDAEAIRDQMLASSGEINLSLGGPYVVTTRLDSGEVVAPEDHEGSRRRSLYLNQKRTQVVSILSVFDAPSIVFNSVRRNTSTMSLQSLALMNSEFAISRARAAATGLQAEAADDDGRLRLAFLRLYSRKPSADEVAQAQQFLQQQGMLYSELADAHKRAWQDLCQALMASSEFIYVQ